MALIILSGLTCLALPFIPESANLPGVLTVAGLAIVAIVLLLIVHLKQPRWTLLNVILIVVILRFVFAGTVIPYRAQSGSATQDKADAYQIAQITENEPLFLLEDSRCSLTTVFYLERERTEVLRRNTEINSQYYYLANRSLLSDQMYEVFYTFAYGDQEFALIKFRDP
ncbi:MAG: hypothetical protein AAF223_17770 [Bacteroidota bacterium]